MLKLVQTDWGQFDLAFDAANDVNAAAATLIYGVLFTDSEAPSGKVDDSYDRRGWWADSQAGTGGWYVRRQPLSPAARREALEMVSMALLWHAPALTDVSIQEVVPDDPSGNVSLLSFEVTGLHNGQKFIVRASL